MSSFIDISYPIVPQMAIYPGNPDFHVEKILDIEKGDSANVSLVSMGSHTGTHIDAPAHFIKDGSTIDQISLERMNGRAKVIDATGRDEIDVDLLQNIDIEEDDILLFSTDNSLRWSCDRVLDEYVTFTYDAADYLSRQNIKLIGLDYLTVEIPRRYRVTGKSVHRSLLERNIIICEALSLKGVVQGTYDFFCFPLKISELDGCPVRACLKDGRRRDSD